ncbi:MAG: hypothetical protein RUDDFDWM_001811 [Candidatus Fervidibacterota bacterium]
MSTNCEIDYFEVAKKVTKKEVKRTRSKNIKNGGEMQ